MPIFIEPRSREKGKRMNLGKTSTHWSAYDQAANRLRGALQTAADTRQLGVTDDTEYTALLLKAERALMRAIARAADVADDGARQDGRVS